jgi:hypothetical protein
LYSTSYISFPDCHDEDASIYPNATDIPSDSVDQNCDGID